MRIAEVYSHLNCRESLLVRKPNLYAEIEEAIRSVDAEQCTTKVSKEQGMEGRLLFGPIDMNASFCTLLRQKQWNERREADKEDARHGAGETAARDRSGWSSSSVSGDGDSGYRPLRQLETPVVQVIHDLDDGVLEEY